eukprot:gene21499-27843_t
MSSNYILYKQLVAQKELYEIESEAITEELTSRGPSNEPPPGLTDPLIDSDGFPRSDIDIYNIKSKRNRLAVLNTDHKNIMKQIEQLLPIVYEELNNNNNVITAGNDRLIQESFTQTSEEYKSINTIKPFAKIDEILQESPARLCGLLDNDLLISFGDITSETTDPLAAIPSLVRQNINKSIILVIQRNGIIMNIDIVPKVWSGRGVLGCHITPIR